jgi:hypothetical protein
MRRWPSVGRHEAALRISGFLARAGWAQDALVHFVETVASGAGDNEISDRRKAALDAAKAHARGENTYGLPALKEHFGEAVASKIASLLGHREVDTDVSLEQMNNRYCLVPYGGKARILTFENDGEREMATYYSASDFKLLHSNKIVPVGDKAVPMGVWWLNHKDRRQYDGVTFAPGESAVVKGRLLNLWRGWGIEPRKGDWSLLRIHIEIVLAAGNKAHAEYILKWTAWTFQNPGEQAEVALVFRGGKATGKGLFGRAMSGAFGQHGLHISSPYHLTGNFNRHLQDCALLFADEAFWPGDKSAEGTLKRIITEPTLFIEAKGVDGRLEKNRLHTIIAANADWVVPASIDERRFAVFEVSEEKKGNRDYFEPLYRTMENGIAAMMYDLLTLDLKGWHPRQDVPQTDALLKQKTRSLPPEDQWWAGLLVEGALPGARKSNPRRAPSADLFEHARRTVPELRYASDHRLGHALAARGCRNVKVGAERAALIKEAERLKREAQAEPDAKRREELEKKAASLKGEAERVVQSRGWEFPPLAEARKEWSSHIPTEWDDDERGWEQGPALERGYVRTD